MAIRVLSVFVRTIPISSKLKHMTRIEGENTRLRHWWRLRTKTLCYSKSIEVLECSPFAAAYLKDGTVHVPLIITFQKQRRPW